MLVTWLKRHWLKVGLAIGVLIVLRYLLPWVASGFKQDEIADKLIQNWGLAPEIAKAISVPVAAFYGALLVPAIIAWMLPKMPTDRRSIKGFLAVLFCFAVLPLLLEYKFANFNQLTGSSNRTVAIAPDGSFRYGPQTPVDPNTGRARMPVTTEIAELEERIRMGIRASRISADARNLIFFNPHGQPNVWYFRTIDGRYELFDKFDFYPGTSTLLAPVTPNIVAEILRQAEAEAAAVQQKAAQAQQQREAQQVAEEQKKQRAIIEAFGLHRGGGGIVAFGAASTKAEPIADKAAGMLVNLLTRRHRERGVAAESLPRLAYDTGYFLAVMNGDTALLETAGAFRMARAVVLNDVRASCVDTVSNVSMVRCTVDVSVRAHYPQGRIKTLHWSETAPGGSPEYAVTRAVELIVERNPVFFDRL